MGLIFKEPKQPKEKKATKVEQPVPAIQPEHPYVASQTVNNIAGVADDTFVKRLWQAIAENHKPGQDYFEFKQSLDAMASLPIDEKNKFLSVFMIFKQQGCKKETITSSIDVYENVIKKEQATFAEEYEATHTEKVKSKQAQIEEAKKKVEDLNKQIVDANTFILTASQEAQQDELKLQMMSANFNQSAEKVLASLESDKNKINTYIQ